MAGSASEAITLLLASAILLASHVLRALRWRLVLAQVHVHTTNFHSLTSLSLGYLLNTLLPFRVGEIIRGSYLAYVAKANPVNVFATILFERTVDLFLIGLIWLLLASHTASIVPAVISLALAGGITGAVFAIQRSAVAKRGVWAIASIFNSQIKHVILHFAQASTELFAPNALNRSLYFWTLTVLMWIGYMSSLLVFSWSADARFIAVVEEIYQSSLLSGQAMETGWSSRIVVYLFIPIVVVIVYSALADLQLFQFLRKVCRSVSRIEHYTELPAPIKADCFTSKAYYGAFLERRFGNTGGVLLDFEERGLGRGLLHRIFHGGSGAVTALIEIDGHLRVRKFATGEAGKRLAVQRDWIEAHRSDLSLVGILDSRSANPDVLYDMAYVSGVHDFYEAIHTDAIVISRETIQDVIERLSEFHERNRIGDADDAVVTAYVTAKVIANYEFIERQLLDMLDPTVIEINGRRFEMSRLGIFRSPEWFAGRLTRRGQAVIHGDLTIENIMISTGGGHRSWFLIDPNPENIFQSPLIDHAKLLQSLHMGYEALNRDPRSSFTGNVLRIGMHRSSQYAELYEFAIADLSKRFGPEGLRQIFLHEMVNFLRLIPYQLRRSEGSGMAFFGVLCLLVLDYEERYPGDLP